MYSSSLSDIYTMSFVYKDPILWEFIFYKSFQNQKVKINLIEKDFAIWI